MDRTLIVRHFPEYLPDESIEEFFGFFRATQVKAAKGRMVILTPCFISSIFTYQQRGTVLVTFENHDMAKKARNELDQLKLLDKVLSADWDKNSVT